METKNDLRIWAKNERKNIDVVAKSKIAVEEIRKTPLYLAANRVLLYYPLKFELNLLELLDDEKQFYLPRVCGNNLQVCSFKNGDKLLKSGLNICEPCSNPIAPQILDLVIVPALMADKSGYRLGYGGGFYDRFLVQNSGIKTILPVMSELFVEKLPFEEFDVKVNEVIVV